MTSVQGRNAILYFYDGTTWIAYGCAREFGVEVSAAKIPIKTVGDGVWEKFEYDGLSYVLNTSGIVTFDLTKFTSFDIFNYQLNFLTLSFRLTFSDGTNIRSVQGTVLVERTAFSVTVGQVVFDSLSFAGTGALYFFVGTTPCATEILSVIVTQADGDSPVVIDVTETGTVFQYKVSIDGGDPAYYDSMPQNLTGLSAGLHTFEVVPICANGFEGIGNTASFTVLAPVDLACPNVTFSIDDVEDDSFTINYTIPVEGDSVDIVVVNNSTAAVLNYDGETSGSKSVTGLTAGTSYTVTIFTNCDTLESGGISDSVTTTGESVLASLANASASLTAECSDLSLGPVGPAGSDSSTVTSGTVTFTVVVTGTPRTGSVTVATESGTMCQNMDEGVAGYVFTGIIIGSGGIEITVQDTPCGG